MRLLIALILLFPLTLSLGHFYPAVPALAVGVVIHWPWIGSYKPGCAAGPGTAYHDGYGLDFPLKYVPLYAAGPGTVYSTFTAAPDGSTGFQYNHGWGNEV